MKKQTLLFTAIAIFLFSCAGDTETTNETTEEVAEVAVPILADYLLNVEESSAKWERTLDQKATKQKVKLFGSMVDVELGEVKMTTNGTVAIKEGGLTTTDDALTSAHVVFDMASFKFAQEQGRGLFDVKQYPNSTLMLNNFSDSTATGTLTIQNTTNDAVVKIATSKAENSYKLTGTFTVNTLDFPLREKVKEKDVNKDEIKVDFELVFQSK